MPDSVTLVLPLPDARLHAHAKGHWRDKTEATKAHRESAYEVARKADHRFSRAELSIMFFWPDNRQRDTLNAVQSCKPYIDGIVDAGVIPGDHWQVLRVGRIGSGIDREKPRVELTVTEHPNGDAT